MNSHIARETLSELQIRVAAMQPYSCELQNTVARC